MAETFELLMTSLNGQKFAVPVQSVCEVISAVETTPFIDKPDAVMGLINLRGAIVPVHDLRHYLGLAPRELQTSDQILILLDGDAKIGVAVDDVDTVKVYREEQLFALSLSPTAFKVLKVGSRRLQLLDLRDLLGEED